MPILDFLAFIISIINRVIVPLVFALAFLSFIWGVAQAFIFNQENKEKREEGRKYIVSGLIGFFIMISVWGLTNVLVGTFGFNNATRPPLPSFGR